MAVDVAVDDVMAEVGCVCRLLDEDNCGVGGGVDKTACELPSGIFMVNEVGVEAAKAGKVKGASPDRETTVGLLGMLPSRTLPTVNPALSTITSSAVWVISAVEKITSRCTTCLGEGGRVGKRGSPSGLTTICLV